MKDKLTLATKSNGDPAPPVKAANNMIREFQLLDGRPICLHKTTVTFAVPFVSDPEKCTVVGVKNSKACPLRIPYASFLQWWLTK